jgi:hypothetical protein
MGKDGIVQTATGASSLKITYRCIIVRLGEISFVFFNKYMALSITPAVTGVFYFPFFFFTIFYAGRFSVYKPKIKVRKRQCQKSSKEGEEDVAIVLTNFKEKQRYKKENFERKVLRDLSLGIIKKEFQRLFQPFFQYSLLYQNDIEDACIDMAIDAYLLGAGYSRFAYHGETLEKIKNRAYEKLKAIADGLFEYWQFWCWGTEMMMESLHLCCEAYVHIWWMEGYKNGEKRYRMKLQ